MSWSLGALVRLARGAMSSLPGGAPWIIPDVEPAWREHIAEAVGFEVRLTDGDDRLDVAFLVSAAGDGRAAWTASAASVDPTTGLAAFFAAWTDPSSPLHAHVSHAWLEFDQHRDGRWPGPPFVTFAIDRDFMPAVGPRPLARLGALVQAGMSTLVGSQGRDVVPNVLAAVGMLPEVGRLAHLAAMPHRGTSGARAIFALPVGTIGGVLRRFGWPGDPDQIDAVLHELWPHPGFVSINVDFTPAVGPRVGVELFRATAPSEDATWDTLLAGLERRGLCAPAKRAAIAAWPARRPEDARRAGRLARHVLVKLVFDPTRLVEAKAYLSAEPQLTLLGPAAGTRPSIGPDR